MADEDGQPQEGQRDHLGFIFNRGGMAGEFFHLAFAFALSRFTRVKCKRKCKRKIKPALPYALTSW